MNEVRFGSKAASQQSNSPAAGFGQERPFARLAKKGFFRAMIRKKEDAYD